jgi:hypothetical protein
MLVYALEDSIEGAFENSLRILEEFEDLFHNLNQSPRRLRGIISKIRNNPSIPSRVFYQNQKQPLNPLEGFLPKSETTPQSPRGFLTKIRNNPSVPSRAPVLTPSGLKSSKAFENPLPLILGVY